MARLKRRTPYDPAKAHDRRATEFSVGIVAHVAAIEVDDPLELGGKLIVMRSTRDDPLGDLHARKMIDEAQYHAGRSFQNDFQKAERGPKAIDFTREAVDGGVTPEPITEAQRASARQLAIVYRALGQDGAAIVHDILVHCQTAAQVACARGFVGRKWADHFSNEFKFRLNQLAFCYGLTNVAPRR